MTTKKAPTKSLHIETTTRCTLACPACPRTSWQNITGRPVIKSDLNIDLLEKFLDCPGGRLFNQFYLCGDYGDTIYYPELLKLIERFRDRVSFSIVTNGSRQSPRFWNQLAEVLTSKDTVCFSIDGLEDTNHLYRVNSDWDSIMQGLDIMTRSLAKVHWKTIVFKHNYKDLDKIKALAESKGCSFHAEKTHRYGNNELIPPEEFIETNHLFHPDFVSNNNIEIEPRCESVAKIISADGHLMPCDWLRNPGTFYKSQLWKQKSRWLEKLKIENNTYDQAIEVVRDWENVVRQNSLIASPDVDVLCKMLCRKNCVSSNVVGFSQ